MSYPCKDVLRASILILFLAGSVLAQSVDDVIEKYAEAVGGMDKLGAVKTVKITGRIIQGSNHIPFVQYIRVPNKIKTETTRQGLTLQTAYDGTIAWTLNPFRGVKIPEKLTPEQTKDLENQADFEGGLINYERKGSKAEYLGLDDFEGSDVYKVRLTDKEGGRTTYYIDVVTSLILKEEVKRKIKEKEQKIEFLFGAYKPIDGIMVPFSIGGTQGTSEIDKVEFNVPIDDSIFKMPETK